MSNLTSTVPFAFNALYNLMNTAGLAQNPPVTVLNQEVVQYEPGSYVLLEGVENHLFNIAALGSYAHEEVYDIHGIATYLQGDVDPATVITKTWAIYQAVVMTPVVSNRGANGQYVLGLTANEPAWIVPQEARYTSSPGDFGGGMAGFQGMIEFRFSLKARITVP